MDHYRDAAHHINMNQEAVLQRLRDRRYAIDHRNKFSLCCGSSVHYLGTTFTTASFNSEVYVSNYIERFSCSTCGQENCKIVEVIK